jgi:2-amino-4-hydroxy-6-hydroxymethyldihydropteridine diphosphokinase
MILVGIGANLPDPRGEPPLATCRAACIALDSLPGLRLRGLSRWWRTEPVPPSAQPWFVNGVALLAGRASPEALLSQLQEIEARMGRERTLPNAARTLDLDLIAVDDMVRDAPDPILPHPRAHLREFVLRPLADVLPGWVHPRLSLSVSDLLARQPPQGVIPNG